MEHRLPAYDRAGARVAAASALAYVANTGGIASDYTRDQAVALIRDALKRRSGKPWSITVGRGTSSQWITISAPPRRLIDGVLSEADRDQLRQLLNLERVHGQGVQIPASLAYRTEYVDRAEGRTPRRIGEPYWD